MWQREMQEIKKAEEFHIIFFFSNKIQPVSKNHKRVSQKFWMARKNKPIYVRVPCLHKLTQSIQKLLFL